MKSITRVLSFLAIIFVISQSLHAQKGAISGTVYDEDGFPMLGANVVIEGTTLGSQTDFIEGKYQFQVDPDTYTVVASYVGYGDMIIPGVVVVGNETTVLDITFSEDSGVDIDVDVTVTAQRLERGEVAVLKLRQNSDKVEDIISSQEIQRLGANNAAAALGKVTGTTVVDGRYVFVRGLGDRYSATTLNGLRIPSIDPYRNSAQLDLIPTSILDNIVASKTFTPDLPGDFTGGSVNVKIKALPERFTWGIGASTSYNPQSNFRNDFLTYDAGERTGLGFNDGTLDLPEIVNDPRIDELNLLSPQVRIPARRDQEIAQGVEDVANSFGNGFGLNSRSTGPDMRFSGSIGNQFNLGRVPLGVYATANYSREFNQYQDGIRGNFFNPGGNTETLQEDFDLVDNRSQLQGSLGGMVGLTLRPSPSNNISFYTLYSHQGIQEGRSLKGSNESASITGFSDDNFYLNEQRYFIERELIDYVVQGSHTINKLNNLKIEWTANLVNSSQDEPDFSSFEYEFDQGRYSAAISRFTPPTRIWRNLTDQAYEGKLDITLPILQNKSRGNNLKFGGSYRGKDRDFNEVSYAYNRAGGLNLTEANGDFSIYLGPDNLGVIGEEIGDRNTIGTYVTETTDLGNSYQGSEEVAAGYLMGTFEITERFRAIAGARVEQTKILVQSGAVFEQLMQDNPSQAIIDAETADIDTLSFMPAVNLVYKVTEASNLRLSYSTTVARPNMREVAPFGAFNGVEPIVFGNPGLTLTSIDNYDLRYEVFPVAGEVLAVSAFFKKFRNPIVVGFRQANQQTQYSWFNTPDAELYGLELEARKSLGFLGESLANFTAGANFTYLDSRQDIEERTCIESQNVDPEYTCDRPFNGQSDFIGNINLSYLQPDKGWDVVLAFNYFSDRLQTIGIVGSPDVFERGRAQLDFNLSKSFDNLKFTFRARNLLNPKFESYSTFRGQDYIFRQYERGQEISLGVSYGI